MAHSILRILIADDDKEDLELLEESLTNVKSDADLSMVHNGKAVLEFLETAADDKLPSLIILDYSMPELSGLDVLRIVCNNSRYENIPVVIFSTSDSPAHIKDCKNQGAVAYFVKPKTLPELDIIAKEMIALCN